MLHTHPVLASQVQLGALECDRLLPREMTAEERTLAHGYHRWPPAHADSPLSDATAALRTAAWATIQQPLLTILEAVLAQAPAT